MDVLYGQKDLAEFCEYVIASLFEVSPSSKQVSHASGGPAYGREGVDTPPYTPPLDGAPRKEPSTLLEFIAYALYRTRLPVSIVHQCLLLLSRLKQRYPSARGTSSSPHRLFLSALMLSAKISMDDTYSNKSWAIVGSNYFALKEVNQMERELFAFLGWNVVVSLEELEEFIGAAQMAWQQAQTLRKSESSKRRRVQEEAARESRHQQAKNAARALLRPHTYRHTSPSPSRLSSSITASSSAPASSSTSPSSASPMSMVQSPAEVSASSSPEHFSAPHQQHHHYNLRNHRNPLEGSHLHSAGSSAPSSAPSSAFPSATHSPTSPASAPLSAGPQTPDSDCVDMHPHIYESADFPEAAAYASKSSASTKARHVSPPRGRAAAGRVSPPALTSSH